MTTHRTAGTDTPDTGVPGDRVSMAADAGGRDSAPASTDTDDATPADLVEHADDTASHDTVSSDPAVTRTPRRGRLVHAVVFLVLPIAILAVSGGAAYAKYLQGRHDALQTARIESVTAAKDITAAMLSYTPDTAAATLGAARDKMCGSLLDSYTSLIDDVVIPGAKQRGISATATVAAAAPLTVTDHHAVVLVFVNQNIVQGKEAPSGTASSVRVTLDKVDRQWRACGFDPL